MSTKEKSGEEDGGPLRSLNLWRDSGMYSFGMEEMRSDDVEEEEDVAVALEFCFVELELEEDDC